MLSHLLQENLGGIVCVIISGIILYSIYRSPVKSYFGRGSSPALSATTQALRICYIDLLRRVNDIGKSLALQKMNKACKQLILYLQIWVCICPIAESRMRLIVCSFIFCPWTASSDLHWYKISTGPYILLVHLLSHLEPWKNIIRRTVIDICSFLHGYFSNSKYQNICDSTFNYYLYGHFLRG